MPRFAVLSLAAVLGIACAVLMSSCGSDGGQLGANQASQINGALDKIEAAANAEDCSQAGVLAAQEAQAIQNNTSIDSKLKNSLVESLTWIQSHASISGFCSGTADTTTTDTTTSDTTTTDTTTTESTPHTTSDTTTTAPPTTSSTTSTPTTTTGGAGGGSGGIGVP